jgi:hypothetical protein
MDENIKNKMIKAQKELIANDGIKKSLIAKAQICIKRR